MDDDLTIKTEIKTSLQLTFLRELDSLLNSSGPHLSNRLFSLLNKFESKLTKSWYHFQLLQIGDSLSHAKEYELAQTHCYERYIKSIMGNAKTISEVINESLSNEKRLSFILKAVIGNGVCHCNIALQRDPEFRKKSTLELSLQILLDMRLCLKAGLKYESLYWLIYNAVTLTYSVARKLLRVNLQRQAIFSLIYSCAAMESCIPLMTAKYLTLRTNLYIAVCASYYKLKEPLQAELFARRGLDKIYHLAKIESLTSELSVSNNVITEATVKLGVMIFKRSVLESHKKIKSILRPKIRPSIKDLLQANWPRSPTERLLDEMFCGHAAHFLAILETLSVNVARPLRKKQPKPITSLDEDTVADVYQELLTAGVDLALLGFEKHEKNGSLLSFAVKGSDTIPLTAIIQFIHLCYQTDCLEGFSMLADIAIELMGSRATSIKAVLISDELQEMSKQSNDDKRIWDKAILLLDVLCTGVNEETLTGDLLLDASLLVWEKICDVFKGITHNVISKSVLGSSKCFEVLRNILFVFHSVNLAAYDPLLYGEVILKYTILLESQADISMSPLCKSDQELLSHNSILYDQSQLLVCLQVIENTLEDFATARGYSSSDSLVQLHTELVNSYWRVKVKLLTTKPPDCPLDKTKKSSSLPQKMIERQTEVQMWKKIVSLTITSSELSIPILSETSLREECSSNHYFLALLLINLAVFSHYDNRTSFLREAVSLLSSTDKIAKTENEFIPPPPIPLEVSPQEMAFSPDTSFPFPVAYYALFGRAVSKGMDEMTKVRLNDCHLQGLGVEVSARKDCVIRVTGLQPNVKYIFAIAAYDSKGNLLGGSISHSTKPILSSYVFSYSIIWGLLCQSAFQLNDFAIGKSSTTVLWNNLVNSSKSHTYKLKKNALNSSLPLLHLFINSVLIQVQVNINEKVLHPDSCDYTLLSSIPVRLNLVRKLLIALEVAGRINSHYFSLQIVIMCYTILVPLIQVFAVTEFVTEVLLQCHAVLQELPEIVLNGKHVTHEIHHMISAISFTLVKYLSRLHEKSLLTSLAESSRLLLSVTLPSTSVTCQGTSSANSTLQNPSLVSTASIAVTSTLSFASQNSFLPTSQDKSSKPQKKRKKKILTLNDDVPDDIKSVQYKVIGAYFLSQTGMKNNDDLDLTGQEDPVFLHVALKTLPIHIAYKEVCKFKRRPQYLEFFAHLCEIALSEGKGDFLLTWSNDVFAWLAKRNEILLSVKAHQVYKIELSKDTPLTMKTHLNAQANIVTGPTCSKIRLSANTETSGSSQKAKVLSGETNQSKSIKKSDMSLTVLKHRITRDDIRTKAVVVLQSTVPSLWHTFRCRQKLRAACNEEHSWRAQVNILLGSCVLEKIYTLLKVDFSHNIYTQDFNGVSLINVLKCYPPIMPQDGSTPTEKVIMHTFESAQIVKLISQMASYYQHAAVLSHRGFCWMLVINACRGLWNGLMILKKYIEIQSEKKCVFTLPELLGLSLRGLYMTSIHLLDAYQSVPFNKAEQLSCRRTLIDEAFMAKFVKMTIEVCYVNHHWEKTLYLSEKLLNLLRSNSIHEELMTITLKAQEQLRQRIQLHSKMRQYKPIDPAAHLDIIGYDIYSKVGHSFGMTTIQPQNIQEDNNKECGEMLLSHAKEVANVFIDENIGSIMSTGSIDDIACSFIKAVDILMTEGKVTLAVDGMNNVGTFKYISGQTKAASHWWQQGLKLLFQCNNILKERQLLLLNFAKVTKHHYMIGSILASKLAKYIYCNEQDVQQDYALLAATLFKCFIQASSLAYPEKDIEYANYKISINSFLAPEVLRKCNPAMILSSLQYTSKVLTNYGYSLEVLPVVCLYEYVAQTYTRDIYHTVFARIYKLKALTQLSSYSDALKLLKELINGAKLPNLSSEFNTNVSSRSYGCDFDDSKFLNYPQNVKVLSYITDKLSLNFLKRTYGTQTLNEELTLAMTNLLIALASTCTEIPSQSQMSSTETGTKLSFNGDVSVTDIKLVLLQTSEGLLLDLLKETKNTECTITSRCKIFFLLSQVALSFCHLSTAAQLCITALRELKATEYGIDVRLWQRLQLLLAKSLSQMTVSSDLHVLTDFPFMSLEGSKLFKNVEVSSQLLYLSACHHYTCQPPSLDQVVFLTQKCVDNLHSCNSLSTFGKDLLVKAALLLTEVLVIKNTSPYVIQESYSGIIQMLENQMKENVKGDSIANDSHFSVNCYRKQLPLLVQAHLGKLLSQLTQSSDNEIDELRKVLDVTISIAQNMAISYPGLVSVLLQQFALLVRKQEHTFQPIIVKALSSALPFDYKLLQDLLFLLGQQLADNYILSLEKSTAVPDAKTGIKLKPKSSYHGWCAVKCAGNIQQHIEKLQYLSSHFDNEDMSFPVSTVEVPTVAVIDLCHSKKLLHFLTLSSSKDSSAEDFLLPFSQNIKSELKWFDLVVYFWHLLKCCFSFSSQLHLHHLSLDILPKALVMFGFLQSFCPTFQKFCVPLIPKSLCFTKFEQNLPPSVIFTDIHQTASNNEITILWHKSAKHLEGLIALNGKSVQGPIKSTLLHTYDLEVHSVTVDSVKIKNLRNIWNELASTCRIYLSQQAVRPLSRSPSRMRQRTLEQSKQDAPADLMKSIESAVVYFLDTFGIVNQDIPCVEPHMVPGIARVLKPPILVTEKGDGFYFFKTLFSCDDK